jgi:hypothetical protein
VYNASIFFSTAAMVLVAFKPVQTRDLSVVRARPIKQNIHVSKYLPVIQSHRRFLVPQVHEVLHGQSRRQQHRHCISTGRTARAARAERPYVIVPVCNHLYGKGSKVQISATAAMSARQYLDRLETETSAARLRQRKVLDFHSTKLNNYLNTIRVHRDDREAVEVLLNSFFRAVQSCADHLEYASGSFSRTIHRTGYKWVHTFLYDQVMRGDLDSSWHHYVASLEEFAFTLGVDLGDTMLDKTHHLWRRALNSDTSIMTVAPKINSNSGNSASTQNQPSGPVEEPNTTWKSVQPLQFSSTKDLAEALVRPEYLTICEQEMGALAERLRNGPQSIEFAIVGQTAVGLVSF